MGTLLRYHPYTLLMNESIASSERLLLAACHENGFRVSGDFRVSERDTARLIGVEATTLKQMRQEGRAPAHYRIGVGGSRISYKLSDIAAWIDAARKEY